VHPLRNFTEYYKVSIAFGAGKHYVFNDSDTVADAKSAAGNNCIPDTLYSVAFTSVDCDREKLFSEIVESCLMPNWQKALLRSGNVKTDNTVLAVPNCKFSNFHSAISVTHCCHQLAGAYKTAFGFDISHALLKPVLDRFDCVIKRQSGAKMLLWSPTDFSVDNSVIVKV
jgi:hypothetical protein